MRLSLLVPFQLQQYQYYSVGLLSSHDPFYEQQRHLLGPRKKKIKEEKKLKGEALEPWVTLVTWVTCRPGSNSNTYPRFTELVVCIGTYEIFSKSASPAFPVLLFGSVAPGNVTEKCSSPKNDDVFDPGLPDRSSFLSLLIPLSQPN